MSEAIDLPAGAAARLAAVPMPRRIANLKRDRRGYPIPRFIDRSADIDGEPDFRIMDGRYLRGCLRLKACWICGEKLGRYMTFPIGPMCAINRNIAEPPSHLECCEYSAKVCPFLAVPAMRRIEKDKPEAAWVSGEMISRNPGVIPLDRRAVPHVGAAAGRDPVRYRRAGLGVVVVPRSAGNARGSGRFDPLRAAVVA